MQIILSKKLGFCFGVRRAFNLALEAINEKTRPCQALGPLVHNESVIKKLQKMGVKFIHSLDRIKKGVVIIPAHGERLEILKEIKEKSLKLIDATCPLVKKVQDLAKNLQNSGYHVIVIGDKGHKEVNSIQGAISDKGIVITTPQEVPKVIIKGLRIAVIAQTTQNPMTVKKIVLALKKKYKNLKFYNTLCPIFLTYQEEIKKLVKKTDLILVIGSKTSANTKRLLEVAQTKHKIAYFIENASHLRKCWFLGIKSGIKKVGIATGTSTPDWLIEETVKRLEEIKES